MYAESNTIRDMTNEGPTTVRLPPAILKRVSALAKAIETLPKYAAMGRPGFSKALRLVIGAGLESVEAEVRKAKGDA
jgi:hypothetical protein